MPSSAPRCLGMSMVASHPAASAIFVCCEGYLEFITRMRQPRAWDSIWNMWWSSRRDDGSKNETALDPIIPGGTVLDGTLARNCCAAAAVSQLTLRMIRLERSSGVGLAPSALDGHSSSSSKPHRGEKIMFRRQVKRPRTFCHPCRRPTVSCFLGAALLPTVGTVMHWRVSWSDFPTFR